MPRRGISGSYSSSIFSFLRNFCIIFHSGCADWHFHQQCVRVSCSPHPHQHLLFVVLLMIRNLPDVRRCLSGVFICVSLMSPWWVLLLFVCLLAVSMCSSEKMSIQVHCPFLIRLLLFLMLSCMSFCIFWIITPYQMFINIFSHSIGEL